jgi:hypothetical protein
MVIILLQVLIGGQRCQVVSSNPSLTLSPTQLYCRAPRMTGTVLAEYWMVTVGMQDLPADLHDWENPGERSRATPSCLISPCSEVGALSKQVFAHFPCTTPFKSKRLI